MAEVGRKNAGRKLEHGLRLHGRSDGVTSWIDFHAHDVPVDNINKQTRDAGTSKAYTLSRLQRESPGLFEAVCRKEMSANAAAIQAGFRKKPSPIDVIRKSWRKLTESEKEMFLKEVQHQKQ